MFILSHWKITVSKASVSAEGYFQGFTDLNERCSPTDSDKLVRTNRRAQNPCVFQLPTKAGHCSHKTYCLSVHAWVIKNSEASTIDVYNVKNCRNIYTKMPLSPEVFGFPIFLKHFLVLQLNVRLDLSLLQVREFDSRYITCC